jgi:uncharacterized membrane protein YoaK (UPF0700 family)
VNTLDPRRRESLPTILAFVAAFVDTLGFIALFGLFTAHVTGNFVLIGAAIAGTSGGVVLKLLAFPAFVVAVAATRLFVLWLEHRQRPALRPILWLQTLLLGCFAAVAWHGAPIASEEAPTAIAAGLLAAAAMGIQNAASRLLLAGSTPTTVMTVTVTQLVIDAVDLLRGSADPALRRRFASLGWPVVAFALGAISAALAYPHVGFAALTLPVAILGVLALCVR